MLKRLKWLKPPLKRVLGIRVGRESSKSYRDGHLNNPIFPHTSANNK